MVTILKIPLYLEVESEPQDRAKVTKTIQTLVIPLIIKHIKAKGLLGSFDRSDISRIKGEIGDIDIKLLSDTEAMAGR